MLDAVTTVILLSSQSFFGHLRMFRQLVHQTSQFLSFPNFVKLIEQAMRYDQQRNVEHHLAPQVLCTMLHAAGHAEMKSIKCVTLQLQLNALRLGSVHETAIYPAECVG